MVKKFFVSLVAISCLSFIGSLIIPAATHAATAENCTQSSGALLGFPTWYKYLNPTFADGECNISAEIPQDAGKILLAVFEIILRLIGVITVCVIVYGGVQYILSQGEPEKTKGAKSTILNAFIGLAIVISATVIVNLIGNSLLV